MGYEIDYYRDPSGHAPVREWLRQLEGDPEYKKIMRWLDQLEIEGFGLLSNRDSFRSIKGERDLYEVKGWKSRVLVYWDDDSHKFVMMHAFFKHADRQPRDIEIAKRRIGRYLEERRREQWLDGSGMT